jgi:hypothetical protein
MAKKGSQANFGQHLALSYGRKPWRVLVLLVADN